MSESIKKYEFKSGLKYGFEILDLERSYKQNKAILTKVHRTGFYGILWIQEGSPMHTIDFETVKLEAGTLLFIEKNCVQKFDSELVYKGKSILFTDEFFSKAPSQYAFIRSCMLFKVARNAAVDISANMEAKHLLQLLVEEYSRIELRYKTELLHNYLNSLLLLLERSKRQSHNAHEKIQGDLDCYLKYIEYLDDSFNEKKKVRYYADQLNITPKVLNRITTEYTGKSPKQLIDERVLLEAKRLLVYTHLSIKEIAYKVGFEEPTNFIKYFRKHSTQTPSYFRSEQS